MCQLSTRTCHLWRQSDIAMLGVLHRAVLRQSPSQFWQWAQLDLRDLRRTPRPDANRLREGRRSIVGLIKKCNMLPTSTVIHSDVKAFQNALTSLLKIAREMVDQIGLIFFLVDSVGGAIHYGIFQFNPITFVCVWACACVCLCVCGVFCKPFWKD